MTSLRCLCELRLRWGYEYPQACYEREPSPSETLSVHDKGLRLFPTVLHFQDTERASEIGIYNAFLLLHLKLLESLNCPIDLNELFHPDVHFTQLAQTLRNPLLLPGEGSQKDIALEICRMVDYLRQMPTHWCTTVAIPAEDCVSDS